LVWFFVVVIFFSLSQSKLPQYILSTAVAGGILLARLFDKALNEKGSLPARLIGRGTLVFAIVCILAALIAIFAGAHSRALANPLHLSPEDAEPLGKAALPAAAVMAVFGVLGIVARIRRNSALCFLTLAFFIPVCGGFSFGLFRPIFEVKSGRSVAEKMPPLSPDTELACLECFPNGLPFYLGRTMTLFSRNGNELTSNYIIATLERNQQWPKQIVPVADFDAWLGACRKPVYLIVRKKGLQTLQNLANSRGVPVQQLARELWGAHLPPLQPLSQAP
jgi:hypothetical protein